MSTARPVSMTRKARVIIPFLFAYGLAVYLVMGAVGDAFSGQSAAREAGVVVERGAGATADSGAAVSGAAVAEALAAVEETPAIQDLVRDQNVAVVRSGSWTADKSSPDLPAPEAGVGVALTIEIPAPTDVDLSTLPGAATAAAADSADDEASRSLAGVGTDAPQIERNVTSLLVLYDPAADKIVAVHPVPNSAPALTTELGPSPEVAQQDARAERRQRGQKRRGRGHRHEGRVTRRG